MLYAALAFAAIAAILHLYFFWLEAFAWTTPRGLAAFGMSPEQAKDSRGLAFNQGFYNLFLTIITALGIVLLLADKTAVGATLFFAGTGSMAAAGLVLLVSIPALARAALIQLAPPAIAIALLIVALV